jgi:hypothetical protein
VALKLEKIPQPHARPKRRSGALRPSKSSGPKGGRRRHAAPSRFGVEGAAGEGLGGPVPLVANLGEGRCAFKIDVATAKDRKGYDLRRNRRHVPLQINPLPAPRPLGEPRRSLYGCRQENRTFR